jgi:hypothetical protein
MLRPQQIAAGLVPYPESWRAHPLYRSLTHARMDDPAATAVITGITNATSESPNRLAKLEARQAYGFRNPLNQRRRVRIACIRLSGAEHIRRLRRYKARHPIRQIHLHMRHPVDATERIGQHPAPAQRMRYRHGNNLGRQPGKRDASLGGCRGAGHDECS